MGKGEERDVRSRGGDDFDVLGIGQGREGGGADGAEGGDAAETGRLRGDEVEADDGENRQHRGADEGEDAHGFVDLAVRIADQPARVVGELDRGAPP